MKYYFVDMVMRSNEASFCIPRLMILESGEDPFVPAMYFLATLFRASQLDNEGGEIAYDNADVMGIKPEITPIRESHYNVLKTYITTLDLNPPHVH